MVRPTTNKYLIEATNVNIVKLWQMLVVISFLIYLSGGVSCCSNISSPDMTLIGDFAPLETGNIWEYTFENHSYGNTGPGPGVGTRLIIILTLTDITHSNDSIYYTFRVEENGVSILIAPDMVTGEINDTCTVTVSEYDGVFETFTFCNNVSVPLFISHEFFAYQTVKNGSDIEYREASGSGYNAEPTWERIYRAGVGLVGFDYSFYSFGGSSTAYSNSIKMTLVSFNGMTVQIEEE